LYVPSIPYSLLIPSLFDAGMLLEIPLMSWTVQLIQEKTTFKTIFQFNYRLQSIYNNV